ncbi:hypothetical protein ACFPPD_19735 [Cohnella suwonensis]|uniref:Deacetylase sirtuin-type domain-containing protein n=1 Tax=Cohnella suwonensis TaxID=696072 RepID=A0ABW0M1A5_9BACL
MPTNGFSNDDSIFAAAEAIRTADCILVSAGAGLSAAAGYSYGNQDTFSRLFKPLMKKGFTRQYELIGFMDWTEEEKWAYWATHVNYIRFEAPESPVYTKLYDLVKDKDYFVFTSNVDGMFYKAGFDQERAYTPQGDYALMQCMKACTQETWPSKPAVDRILPVINRDTLTVNDPDVIPYCPNCGGPMFLNVRIDRYFIEKPYESQRERFMSWLQNTLNRKICLIELGVGFNTPSVIRWPMENVTHQHPNATLLRVNPDHPQIPEEIKQKSQSYALDAKTWVDKVHLELL